MKTVKTLTLLSICVASITIADDFKTTNGKEYKNATVTRVEPDGIMVKTKSVLVKLYFADLPKDVQQRLNYDPQRAAAYSAEQNAAIQKSSEQLGKEQAGIQWMRQRQQDAASLQFQLQTLYQEKYNTMEHIRLVSAAPEYVETGRDSRGHIVRSLNSVKADLPILRDHLSEVEREIKSVRDRLK